MSSSVLGSSPVPAEYDLVSKSVDARRIMYDNVIAVSMGTSYHNHPAILTIMYVYIHRPSLTKNPEVERERAELNFKKEGGQKYIQ